MTDYISNNPTRKYAVQNQQELDSSLNSEGNRFKFGDKFYIINDKKTKILDENNNPVDYID